VLSDVIVALDDCNNVTRGRKKTPRVVGRVGPMNSVLDGGPNFGGKWDSAMYCMGRSDVDHAETAGTVELPYRMVSVAWRAQ